MQGIDHIVTNKNPGPGKDILRESANNLYRGVSMADLKGFTEKYGLNSRLVKKDGKLVEEVYRIDGMYGKQITEIVKHLEAAIPFATEPLGKALAALAKFYRTGEKADREAYDIAWVQDKASPIDTINGFIEVYLDPRGIKGGWEALVFYVNKEKTERIHKLAADAQWFEDHMPWDPKYRKAGVTGVSASAIDAVVECARYASCRRRAQGLDQRTRCRAGRGAPDVRRAPHRQTAARAPSRGADRRATRVGP